MYAIRIGLGDNTALTSEHECQTRLLQCHSLGGLSSDFLMEDPDFDNVRQCPWFISLLEQLRHEEETSHMTLRQTLYFRSLN